MATAGTKSVELAPTTARAPPMDHSDAPFQTMPDVPPNSVPPKPVKKRRGVEDGNRTAHFHGNHLEQYGDNTIATSKYSWWSFLPRSLFEQFRRVANVYFLGISVLMLIGTYLPKIFESPLSAWSTLGPLGIVLAITMCKEGAEDWTRHKSDREVNNRTCRVLQPDGSEKEVLWRLLSVGSIIRVENRSEVPADVIVLQTSEPKSACYVETSNIDGETNLKLKEACAATATTCATPEQLAHATGEIEYEPPNDRIHNFTGKMRVNDAAYVGVGARNMVLRGCTLRNTKWMLGLVVYSGRDTKVMKKSTGARSKMSQVERTMNMCIQIIFLAQFVLCTVTVIAWVVWNNVFSNDYPYLHSGSVTLWIPDWLGNWFTFLLLFNNFIPISLYVTVEMVNYAQAFLINTDAEMYDPESDTPARARTSNLNQDLGQIEYVFSDKTGTLTRNVMEFKQCSVAGRVFGTYTPEGDSSAALGATKSLADIQAEVTTGFWGSLVCYCKRKPAPGGGSSWWFSPARQPVKPQLPTTAARVAGKRLSLGSSGQQQHQRAKTPTSSGFEDDLLMRVLRSGSGGTGVRPGHTHGSDVTPQQRDALERFFMCMAVCHTVVPETDPEGGPPIYQAESPDEGALTKAARDVGFEFFARFVDHIIVQRVDGSAQPTHLRYDIFGVHEFNSTRKRMAVVARGPDGRYLLMVKGADNVIFDRAITEIERPLLETQLSMFASTGLRTLVLAQRELSPQEFAAWRSEYDAAGVSIEQRDEKLAAVAEKYERDLTVLGATAIEDRLQDGVPGTIHDLARAGIKTWVLTGDKVETAINIGFSCRLLDPSMELIKITSEDKASVRDQLMMLQQQFQPLADDPITFLDRLFQTRKYRAHTRAMSGSFASRGTSFNGSIRGSGSEGHPPLFTSKAPPEGSYVEEAVTMQNPSDDFASRFSRTPSPQQLEAQEKKKAHAASGSKVKVLANIGIIVTGTALTHILGDDDCEHALLTVARCCKAVVACRVSPQQKANIVKMVRMGVTPHPMTLAIGDGANDVGMIQRAEVGIGISGKEGLQAANAADFSIAQFRFLRRLLLVHGRWDYRRMTKVVLYSFYKNVLITLSLFYYNALASFSGVSFYESLVYSSYNFVLGLPIIFLGILDRDVSAQAALEHPALYFVGLNYMDLNARKMVLWIATAVAHSLVVFWIPYGLYAPVDGTEDGKHGWTDGMDVSGLMTFCSLVWGMQVKVALETRTWTWLNHLVLAISMLGFYLFIAVYSLSTLTISPSFYYVAQATFNRGNYWLMLLLVCGAMFTIEFAAQLIRRELMPATEDIAAELDAGLSVLGPHVRVPWGDEDEDHAAVPECQPVQSPIFSPNNSAERPSSMNSDGSSVPQVLHLPPQTGFFPPSPSHAGGARVAGSGGFLPPPPPLPHPGHGLLPLPAAAPHGHGTLPPLHHAALRLTSFEQPQIQVGSSPRTAPVTAPQREPSFVRDISGGSAGAGIAPPLSAGGPTRSTSQGLIRPSAPPMSAGSVLRVSARDALGGDQQRLARMGVVEAASLRNFDYSNLNRGGTVSPGSKVPSPTPDAADDTYL